jgi:hypothetical protein
MAALRWTAVAAITGLLAGPAAASAQEPTPTPTATPVPTPTPTPLPSPVPVPVPPPPAVAGTVIYIITVTTTTTTTEVNAPITWVAAPITSNTTNTSATNGTTATNVSNTTAGAPGSNGANGADGANGAGATGGQTELSLRGCGRVTSKRAARSRAAIQTARIRVPSDAQLVVHVNGKAVGNLQLDPGARKARGIPLRVKLAANGVLTVDRPSGRILRVQACTPK